jgi:hypothetical protein
MSERRAKTSKQQAHAVRSVSQVGGQGSSDNGTAKAGGSSCTGKEAKKNAAVSGPDNLEKEPSLPDQGTARRAHGVPKLVGSATGESPVPSGEDVADGKDVDAKPLSGQAFFGMG